MTPHLYEGSGRKLPDDQELELLTEYVGGFMTDAEAEKFEERLMDDEEFFERMEPMLDEWYAPGVLPMELEIAAQLQAERGSQVVVPGRRLRRYSLRTIVPVLLAAGLAVALISVRHRTAVVAPTRLAQHVTPKDSVPRPTTPSVAPAVSKRRPRRSGTTQLASREPIVAVIPSETAADSALADSAMRAAGPIPAAQTTRSSAVVATQFAPTPTTSEDTSLAATDTTKRNVQEQMRDKTNATKTGASETIAKPGFWGKIRGWLFGIPQKKLLTHEAID